MFQREQMSEDQLIPEDSFTRNDQGEGEGYSVIQLQSVDA